MLILSVLLVHMPLVYETHKSFSKAKDLLISFEPSSGGMGIKLKTAKTILYKNSI